MVKASGMTDIREVGRNRLCPRGGKVRRSWSRLRIYERPNCTHWDIRVERCTHPRRRTLSNEPDEPGHHREPQRNLSESPRRHHCGLIRTEEYRGDIPSWIQYPRGSEVTRFRDVRNTDTQTIQTLRHETVAQPQKRTLELCVEKRQRGEGSEYANRYVEPRHRCGAISSDGEVRTDRTGIQYLLTKRV